MHINKNKTRATKKLDICLVQDEFAFFFLQLHLASIVMLW